MSEWRADPITGRWVVIAADEPLRRRDFDLDPVAPIDDGYCPLCEGEEAVAGREIHAVRPAGPADGRGWLLRVVPNRVPALRVEGTLDHRREGAYECMHGLGAHEVVIETPRHDAAWATMPLDALARVLVAWRDRLADLKHDTRMRAALVVKNEGVKAGARLAHPHSQVIAMPVVPPVLAAELAGAHRHYATYGRCVFCAVVGHELAARSRIVRAADDVVALCPYAAAWPFETWVLPRAHHARFEQAPESLLAAVAGGVQDVAQRMARRLERPALNVVLHSAPYSEAADDAYHWHLEVVPRVLRATGFDLGSGTALNPVAPEEAARVLRG
ncbi:MAG: galactose-1-phosphate uridylyltransferase [Vicinamibacterales bacterium]